MNFFGMGTLEIVAVLLVAFIFLGPQRMIDAARLIGKATMEMRRLSESFSLTVMDEDQADQQAAQHSRGDGRPENRVAAGTDEPGDRSGASQGGAGPESTDDAPVAFRRSTERKPNGRVVEPDEQREV